MNIQVDTPSLTQKSSEIKMLNNDLRNTMEQVEQLVLSVSGDWQGDAERAFAERIIYVKKQFSHIGTFFDDLSEMLKRFADTYDQAESDLSSKINLT